MDREQSEFNMAVDYLARLNTQFYISNDASMRYDAHQWAQSLAVLFRELSTKMTEEEARTQTKELKEIFDAVNQHNARANKGRVGIDPELYWRLHTFELFIRQVLKASGLESKTKDDWLTPDESW